jgi:outer membrane protein OmpA-like peptidoglycan-associated protein
MLGSNLKPLSRQAACLALLCIALANAQAQLPPGDASKLTAEQMVEQLRAAPIASAPRTRSFRNLIVEQTSASGAQPVDPPAPPPSKPSLSMQVQFEFASAKISSASMQSLDTLAVALASPTLLSSKFAVEGHTDAVGQASVNDKLSQARADAVRQYLIGKQIEGERLHSVGKGSRELADPSEPKAAVNRRVRIVNLD